MQLNENDNNPFHIHKVVIYAKTKWVVIMTHHIIWDSFEHCFDEISSFLEFLLLIELIRGALQSL